MTEKLGKLKVGKTEKRNFINLTVVEISNKHKINVTADTLKTGTVFVLLFN